MFIFSDSRIRIKKTLSLPAVMENKANRKFPWKNYRGDEEYQRIIYTKCLLEKLILKTHFHSSYNFILISVMNFQDWSSWDWSNLWPLFNFEWMYCHRRIERSGNRGRRVFDYWSCLTTESLDYWEYTVYVFFLLFLHIPNTSFSSNELKCSMYLLVNFHN